MRRYKLICIGKKHNGYISWKREVGTFSRLKTAKAAAKRHQAKCFTKNKLRWRHWKSWKKGEQAVWNSSDVKHRGAYFGYRIER